jgi:galactose-1-phosphate uridylyltransferase
MVPDHFNSEKPLLNGKWGIFQDNQSIPTERFDPFCSYIDKEGNFIGHKSIISPIRAQRPIEWEPEKEIQDPPQRATDTFCRIVNGELPAIVISKDLKLNQDFFSTNAYSEKLISNVILSIINLYPPIARVTYNPPSPSAISSNFVFGISLVHLFSKHYFLPEEAPKDQWIMFLRNYSLTIKSCLDHPRIKALKGINIHSFFNIGAKAGASTPHLHGQSVLYWDQKGIGSKHNTYWKTSEYNQEKCTKCILWKESEENTLSHSLLLDKRMIFQNDNWKVFLAYAPEKDAHIRLLPRKHISHLWSLNNIELNDLAIALIKANYMLTGFIKEEGRKYQLSIDRNIIIRQFLPNKGEHFHMFIDILPVQQLGGAEEIDNQKFSLVYPEVVASEMKKTSK